MGASFFDSSIQTQPIIDSVNSAFVCFQTDDALRADHRIMDSSLRSMSIADRVQAIRM
jgi:hypothetical protein